MTQEPQKPAPFEEFSEVKSHPETEAPMPKAVVRRHWAVRDLILDYAIANAIIGLNPVPGTLTYTLIIGAVLVIVMMRHIGKKWGFAKGQDILAIVGNLFGWLGALAISLMAWLTIFAMGLVFPPLRAFDISAALFTFTWMVGQITDQFYLNGRLKRDEA